MINQNSNELHTNSTHTIWTFQEVQHFMRFKSRSGFSDFMKSNPHFPKPFSLGGRKMAFLSEEVQEYVRNERKKHLEANRGRLDI